MTQRSEFDVIVIGSGAGGGVVASELARGGREVVLLEVGEHHTSDSFRRWEVKANRDLFWPTRFAMQADDAPVALLSGRSVGGTTTINTKVGLRANAHDVAKWHEATGLTNDEGEPFSVDDLTPYYEHVENMLGVRERSDWGDCVHNVRPGFRALGTDIEPVWSYTDEQCQSYGSCLQGCPSDGGKSTANTFIAWALSSSTLDLRTGANARRILIDGTDDRRATGAEYVDADGAKRTVHAPYVVAAAGPLNTPQLLMRSGVTNPAIGQHLGFHPLRLVHGLFDEPQDAHRVYPISAHCMDHRNDDDGGFVIEASTIMDPIAFATTARDEHGVLWGPALVEAVRQYRYWNGLLAMVNDENHGSITLDDDGNEAFTADFQPSERARLDDALDFSRRVLEAAGAKQVLWTDIIATHTQGSARMGDDPARSAVDRNGECHDVRGLFVGDASLVPRTLSVNPSLTVMALATRLALHLDTRLSEA